MSQSPAEPALPKVSKRESGYATTHGSTWWSDLTDEETPELQWPLSLQVFDRMRRQDAQVASVLRAVTSPILRTQWSIEGRGADPEVTRFVARNLGLPIKDADPDEDTQAQLRGRDRFSWDEHLRHALLMLPFGHMYFEQTYRETSPGRFDLRKLGPRMPRSIESVKVAPDGGLVSIKQHRIIDSGGLSVTGSSATKPIPVTQLVAYVLEREGGNWLGQSLLRSAYKNWLLKDRALRSWSTLIDRQSMGIPIFTGPEGGTEEHLDRGEELAQSARSGEDAGGAIPHGAEFALVGVSGTLPDIDKFVRYLDEQIARAVLAHFLNLGTQTGSWALGSTFADFFTLSLQAVAEQIRDTATRHIIEDLVDINFGSTVPAPRLVFDEIGTRATELDRVREATGLTSDADLVKYLRSIPNQEAA